MAQVNPPPDCTPRASYDVVVVGAGIGGLAAGALLADAGARVLVVERQAVLGGYCHSWYRKVKVNGEIHKFRFDAGTVEFSGAHDGGTLSVLFDRLRLRDRIEWLRCDHTYRIGQTMIRVPPDWRDYVAQLGTSFPSEALGIAAFFDAMRLVAESRHWLAAANGGFARQARNNEERARFQREHAFAAKWGNRPVVELLATYVTQAAARTALLRLSHFLTADIHTLTVGSASNLYRFYFVGGYYPSGGTGLVANTLADSIREHGGHIMSRTDVLRIRLEGGRVRGVVLDDGQEIDADIVVSNSDFRRTFGELLPVDALAPELRVGIDAMTPTASGFTVYLAMDCVPTDARSYTVDGNYAFHIPSLLDPTAAAPGCSVFEVRTIFDKTDSWFRGHEGLTLNAWRKTPEYALRKRRFGDWLLARAEGLVPNLRKHILYRTDASPLTYARYSHASHGALYGWAGRPAAFDGGCTPFDGLYIVGSSALGAGVEGAVISAANAAHAIVPGLLSCGARFPTRRVSATDIVPALSS